MTWTTDAQGTDSGWDGAVGIKISASESFSPTAYVNNMVFYLLVMAGNTDDQVTASISVPSPSDSVDCLYVYAGIRPTGPSNLRLSAYCGAPPTAWNAVSPIGTNSILLQWVTSPTVAGVASNLTSYGWSVVTGVIHHSVDNVWPLKGSQGTRVTIVGQNLNASNISVQLAPAASDRFNASDGGVHSATVVNSTMLVVEAAAGVPARCGDVVVYANNGGQRLARLQSAATNSTQQWCYANECEFFFFFFFLKKGLIKINSVKNFFN